MVRIIVIAILAVAAAASALGWHFRPSGTRLTALPQQVEALVPGVLPRAPAHVVVVIEENKEYSDIIGNVRHAPYLNSLAAHAAVFTRSYGVAHPSQPNYLALFAGVTDENGDGCPPRGFDPAQANLATELAAAHRRFTGYAEDLPAPGFRGCWAGQYGRKHAPWVDFTNVPDSENLPFSAFPRYDRLPDVAFVVPNLLDDMHSAGIDRGDAWLRAHIAPLVDWAMKHDTLVVITWDESDDAVDNHIPTIFAGPMVRPGRYPEPLTHYRVLRTIEQLYGLRYSGRAAGVAPVTDVWKTALSHGT